jgi:hypothetical protein
VTLLTLVQQQQTADPFFTNDPIGYIRVMMTFIVGMSPAFVLTVWFLRRGPDDRISAIEKRYDAKLARYELDLTALGQKVDALTQLAAQDRERMIQLQRENADHHREQLDMLRTSAAQIQTQIHQVDLAVARLDERSNIGEVLADSFVRYGDKISGALREQNELRDRDHRDLRGGP